MPARACIGLLSAEVPGDEYRFRERTVSATLLLLVTVVVVVLVLPVAADAVAATTSTTTSGSAGHVGNHENSNDIGSEQNTRKNYNWAPEGDHPCNIRKVSFLDVRVEFGPRGLPPLYPEPVVIVAGESDASRNAKFQNLTHRDEIVEFFPSGFNVTLSSSNALSERRRRVPLRQYLDEIAAARETPPTRLANESWYLFGETYGPEWKALLEGYYELPPCSTCAMSRVALSFGIGNRGSGVQWHVHGPGFSEAVWGRKHWVLYRPDTPPQHYNKDQSSRQWMEYHYSDANPKPYECTRKDATVVILLLTRLSSTFTLLAVRNLT